MNIALLQTSSLGLKDPKIESYIKTLKKQNVSLMVFGEYVLNNFFMDDDTRQSKETIDSISRQQLEYLKTLSKKYKISILAPLLLGENVKNKLKLYKTITLIQNDKTNIYHQQKLINYPHWNEKKFFDNNSRVIKKPLIFMLDGVKCATMFGFEMHFDEFWIKLKKEKVQAVIVPTASCFDSTDRWRKLCEIRAFTNSMAVIRINKMDKITLDGNVWDFYGDSLLVSANGDIIDGLEHKEGLLVHEINPKEIDEIRISWGF